MRNISVLLLICFFLTGCSNAEIGKKIVPITNQIYFTAEIKTANTTFNYYVEINKDSEIYMEYINKNDTSPAGFDYDFKNNTVIYKYKELVFKTDISELNTSSTIDFIPSVYKYFIEKNPEIYFSNQNYLIDGKTEKYDFTVYFGQTGLPIRLEERKNNIAITITNSGIIS